MTRTVEDGGRIFNVVAGYDPADPLSVRDKRERDYTRFLRRDGLAGKRIGVFRALVDHDDADPEILEIFSAALAELEKLRDDAEDGVVTKEDALALLEDAANKEVTDEVVEAVNDLLGIEFPEEWNEEAELVEVLDATGEEGDGTIVIVTE